jgi:hypothetical protein
MAEGSYRRKTARYWQEVRESALAELAELRAQRDIKESELEALNQEIVRLEQAVSSLNPLTSNEHVTFHVGVRVEGIASMGLADACREILKQSPTYRTARGIRDSLRDSGYNLEQHSNPLASIHGVLKRFVEAKEVELLETEGKSRYRFVTKSPKPKVIPGVTGVDPALLQVLKSKKKD